VDLTEFPLARIDLSRKSNLQHDHKHTPCHGCDCGLAGVDEGRPLCEGDRCEGCMPVPACFGRMTQEERHARIWRATHERLILVLPDYRDERRP
jgi:hypothetical protein